MLKCLLKILAVPNNAVFCKCSIFNFTSACLVHSLILIDTAPNAPTTIGIT